MNWSAIAAICSCLGVLATIIGVAYTSGRMSEKIRDHGEKIDSLTITARDHGERLNEHDIALEKIKAYQNGYNAASNLRDGNSPKRP